MAKQKDLFPLDEPQKLTGKRLLKWQRKGRAKQEAYQRAREAHYEAIGKTLRLDAPKGRPK